MGPFLDSLLSTLGVWIPRLIGVVLILLVGWLLARLLSGLARRLLGAVRIDNRLAKWLQGSSAKPISIEGLIASVVYYGILFLAVLAALNALGLAQVASLFSGMFDRVFVYVPKLAFAAVLALIAWLVATVLKAIVVRVLSAAGVDKRLGGQAGTQAPPPISAAIGEAVYWLVWLLFLPVILNVLGFVGLLAPVQNMINGLLAFLPNLLAAAVILVIGLFIARILQRVVASALHAFGADALSERVGLAKFLGETNLSGLLGYVVYVIVFIPVVIAALNALQLDYLVRPISEMLNKALAWIPNILSAVIVLAVAYFIGRILADIVATLLKNTGLDKLATRAGLVAAEGESQTSLSQVVGYLVLVAIMLIAAQIAAGILQWAEFVVLVSAIIAFLGRLVLAVAVLVVGIFLANVAARVILATALEQKRLLALLARVAIVAFASIMALEQTGIASTIVSTAFGVLLGGVALAIALAFGLGGRDVAKYQLVRWYRGIEAELEDKKEA